jgi:hypothetical protein
MYKTPYQEIAGIVERKISVELGEELISYGMRVISH